MRRIVHLSDLHFGRTDQRMVDSIVAMVNSLEPNLVVVSGDFTQRAKVAEFEEARKFLESLPQPQLVVPGNHDIPLFNVWNRLFRQLDNYKKYITPDLQPHFEDSEILVIGLNTARSLVWKEGRINIEQIEGAASLMEQSNARFKIVVSHHPFDVPENFDGKVVGRANLAISACGKHGVDLFLSGHYHKASFSPATNRYEANGCIALVVHAGTSISTRSRGEANSFNLLLLKDECLTIEKYIWHEESRGFSLERKENFLRKTGEGWARVIAPGPNVNSL